MSIKTSSMILLLFIVIIIFSSLSIYIIRYLYYYRNKSKIKYYNDNTPCSNSNNKVPFFYIPSSSSSRNYNEFDTKDPFRNLAKALQQYQNDVNTFISSMVFNVEFARKTEWIVYNHNNNKHDNNKDESSSSSSSSSLFSSNLERRIQQIAELSEKNYFILESLLRPFEFVLGLPNSSSTKKSNDNDDELDRLDLPHYDDNKDTSSLSKSSYDSAMQVITHIVRDWTRLGKGIRINLYDWIIKQLLANRNIINDSSILIPGAGLGRLASDIACAGFHVEANEISIIMAAAAYQILNQNIVGEIYPFVNDHQINEVNTMNRYQKVSFPDNDNNNASCQRQAGSLSYTVGDFIEIFSTNERKEQYGALVTCFFIDTASNIYEYLLVIRNVLKNGGLWINVGPLQWHGNAKLNPSGDELRMIIESLGFVVHSWVVDEGPLNYRHDDTNELPRYTKFEGYKPLRFVATVPSSSASLSIERMHTKKEICMIRAFFARNKNHDTSSYCNNIHSDVVIEEL